MNDESPLPRSPELMSPADTALIVVDVQEKLTPVIEFAARVVWNIRRLLDSADALALRALATEQYPQGLGGTLPELASKLGKIHSKLSFSCTGCEPFVRQLESSGATKVLVAGIETHVCVQQTVLDLLAAGYRVFVPVDAVGSRFAIDRETGLRRMESAGATLTTTEAALFEWCQRAGTPAFKKISALVREASPA